MLEKLVEISNRYGSNPEYVLAGGGNTSYKEDDVMYIKGSGTALGTIKAEDFVGMDRAKLTAMLSASYPAGDKEREAAALKDLMDARLPGNGEKRPSVETPLHNMFPYKYVLHVHPALVNGLTCGKTGEADAKALIKDAFVWVPISRPGYALSKTCSDQLVKFKSDTGVDAKIVLLQNHGIFVAADTVEEIDEIMDRVMKALSAKVSAQPNCAPTAADDAAVASLKKDILALYSTEMAIDFISNKQIMDYISSPASFAPLAGSFTPDHIVYCKARFMYVEKQDELSQVFELFVRDNGYLPKVICVRNVGAFIIAASENELGNAKLLFDDAVKVAVYTESFGGYLHMTAELVDFILNWEAESYRQKVASK